jgi:hypothetical protein
MINSGISDYLCIKNKTLQVVGSYFDKVYKFISVAVTYCNNDTYVPTVENPHCKSVN